MARKLTLALAESMTCGLAAHLLSTLKGTSEVLRGSVVCYTPEVKTELLGIPAKVIEKYSAESKKVTGMMAEKLSKLVSADIFAAITGLASDGGSETPSKPVGTVFYAIRYKDSTFHRRVVYHGTPLEIRTKAALGLYDFIEKTLA